MYNYVHGNGMILDIKEPDHTTNCIYLTTKVIVITAVLYYVSLCVVTKYLADPTMRLHELSQKCWIGFSEKASCINFVCSVPG